jgi:hypothetical protein
MKTSKVLQYVAAAGVALAIAPIADGVVLLGAALFTPLVLWVYKG